MLFFGRRSPVAEAAVEAGGGALAGCFCSLLTPPDKLTEQGHLSSYTLNAELRDTAVKLECQLVSVPGSSLWRVLGQLRDCWAPCGVQAELQTAVWASGMQSLQPV